MSKLSFMIYYICLKIIETQTDWQSNSVRRDHAIWPRVKMERTGQIQYRKIQQWIKKKTENKYQILERIIYSNPLMWWLVRKSRQTL